MCMCFSCFNYLTLFMLEIFPIHRFRIESTFCNLRAHSRVNLDSENNMIFHALENNVSFID